MSDSDCEALASACAEHLKSGGDVITEAAFASGWQAARDHHTPQLTEQEAVKLAAEAMFTVEGDDIDGYREFDDMARAALKAVGMRFKDSP